MYNENQIMFSFLEHCCGRGLRKINQNIHLKEHNHCLQVTVAIITLTIELID